MDEATLRAIMPIGFGKQALKRKSQSHSGKDTQYENNTAGDFEAQTTSQNTFVQSKVIIKELTPLLSRPSQPNEDIEENDGLTVEERAANEALQNMNGDDESHSDGDSSDDLGPEPEEGVHGELPISHVAILEDHTKVGHHSAPDKLLLSINHFFRSRWYRL